MSTTTIPEEVQTHRSIPSYRIAGGSIQTGREVDGTLEFHKQVIGEIIRVGIHNGETDDGRVYARIEADLNTSSGKANIGVTVYDSPSTAAITFLQGLLKTSKGEIIVFEANQARKPNKYGKFATYANLYKYDPLTQKATPIGPSEPDWDTPMDVKFTQLCDALKKHDAYADRPMRDNHAGGPWEALAAAATAAGWPDYFANVDAYIDWLSVIVKRELKVPDDITADEWTMITAKVPTLKGAPKVLLEAVAKHGASANSADAFDPFADE